MITLGAFEAKTHLSTLLDQVADGEEVVITKHGKPVARLVGAQQVDKSRVAQAMRSSEPCAKPPRSAACPGRSCAIKAGGERGRCGSLNRAHLVLRGRSFARD